MEKDNSYLTISKTANKIGVQPHVLRFWEKNFFIINPKKKGLGGRRYYSSSDIEVLILIKGLLYTDGFTIKGAVNYINEKYKKNNNSKSKDEVFTFLYPELNKAIDLIKDGYKIIQRNLN
jgi:DNA-binding transcriptional MerR regulator